MKSQSKTWFWQSITVLYTVFFGVTLYLAYTGKLAIPLSHPWFDKVGHFVLYAIPTFLGHRILGFRRIRIQTVRIPLFPLLFTIFTIAEESVQSLSPNRTFDLIDLVCSFIGIGFGYWFAEKCRKS